MAEYVRVALASELLPGGKKLLDIEGRAVALFNADGQFYAIDDVCTHDGGPLAEGELHGCEIECPRHGARFDVRTGAALCMPAFEPVARHQVMVENGVVFVRVNE
ncbi:MAG: non-heme iron oxygenase ferredoxin subunit [Planctomycetes bacterium]|nr:non-heme iron oxygenase ferredoxin subunit [Planctomycetota bacterium]